MSKKLVEKVSKPKAVWIVDADTKFRVNPIINAIKKFSPTAKINRVKSRFQFDVLLKTEQESPDLLMTYSMVSNILPGDSEMENNLEDIEWYRSGFIIAEQFRRRFDSANIVIYSMTDIEDNIDDIKGMPGNCAFISSSVYNVARFKKNSKNVFIAPEFFKSIAGYFIDISMVEI